MQAGLENTSRPIAKRYKNRRNLLQIMKLVFEGMEDRRDELQPVLPDCQVG